MKPLSITVERTNTGFSAGADGYPVYSAGDSLEGIKTNMVDALNLYFEYNKKPLISASDIKLKCIPTTKYIFFMR